MANVECIQEAVRMLVAKRQARHERDAGRGELESNRLELLGRQQLSHALTAKPPSGAWTVSQRAGRSPAVRKEWATSGGTATNPPEETVIVWPRARSRRSARPRGCRRHRCGPATCSPAEYRAWVIVTSSRATRMPISRFSRRRIASPQVIGTITPPMSTSAFIAWLLSWSSRARNRRPAAGGGPGLDASRHPGHSS